MLDLHSVNPISLYNDNKTQIEINRSKFEKHKYIVETINQAEKEEYADFEEIEEEEQYIDEETTSTTDVHSFENQMKKDARKILSNHLSSSYTMEDEDYLNMIKKLNRQQLPIFDDVVQRAV